MCLSVNILEPRVLGNLLELHSIGSQSGEHSGQETLAFCGYFALVNVVHNLILNFGILFL